MNKNILIAAAAIIVLAGGYMYFKNASTQPVKEIDIMEEKDDDLEDEAVTGIMEKEEEEETVQDQAAVKTFNLEAENFEFDTTEIRVKQGDRVRIELEVEESFHDWVVDEFNARIKQTAEGKTDSVEFIADKKGTFEYYCSVGNHRQQGMVGKLIVE